MQVVLDWSVLWRPPYGDLIVNAVLMTIKLSLISWAFALVIGTVVGIARSAPLSWVRILATAHVEIFRNIPLIVQLFFMYYVLPRLLPLEARQVLFEFGWEVLSAILTLTLYTSAKVAEHIRGSAQAIEHKVKWAALSTGLSWWAAQRLVIAPLVLRVSVPNLTSEFVTVFKSSSIAMAVGVVEMAYLTQEIGYQTFRWIEADALGTLVYLTCAWIVAGFMSLVERYSRVVGLLQRGNAT